MNSDAETPLDPELAKEFGALGTRIRDALAAIIAELPERERHAKALAQRFDLQGVVARRLVRASSSDGGLITLTRLPSAEHVRRFAAAAQSVGLDEACCARLRSSIDEVEALRPRVGGPKARLTVRIRATLQAQGSSS